MTVKGIHNAAENIIKICQEFLEETSLDTLEDTYKKLARQEHEIRTQLNSMVVYGKRVQCPKCKCENVDIPECDPKIEIMRCKCRECGQFFIENFKE